MRTQNSSLQDSCNNQHHWWFSWWERSTVWIVLSCNQLILEYFNACKWPSLRVWGAFFHINSIMRTYMLPVALLFLFVYCAYSQTCVSQNALSPTQCYCGVDGMYPLLLLLTSHLYTHRPLGACYCGIGEYCSSTCSVANGCVDCCIGILSFTPTLPIVSLTRLALPPPLLIIP